MRDYPFAVLVGCCLVLAATTVSAHSWGRSEGHAAAVAVERPVGWVCGAREKMDGTEYRLYLCDDGAQLSGVVAVSKAVYDTYTNPMGQDWKGER